MSSDDETTFDALSENYVVMVAFGLVLVVFAVIPQTRTVALLLLWLLGPGVAYGSLAQVLRGRNDIRSARGLVFALICGFLALVTVPLGFVVVSETLSQSLQFFGYVSAVVAIAFARASVTRKTAAEDRHVPPIDPDEFSDGSDGVR